MVVGAVSSRSFFVLLHGEGITEQGKSNLISLWRLILVAAGIWFLGSPE